MQIRGTAPMLSDGAHKTVTSMLHTKPVGRPRKASLEPGLSGKGMKHRPLQGGHNLRRALAHAKARGGK